MQSEELRDVIGTLPKRFARFEAVFSFRMELWTPE